MARIAEFGIPGLQTLVWTVCYFDASIKFFPPWMRPLTRLLGLPSLFCQLTNNLHSVMTAVIGQCWLHGTLLWNH